MSWNTKPEDNICNMQDLGSEQTWSEIQKPWLAALRRSEENAQGVYWPEVRQTIRCCDRSGKDDSLAV